MALERKAQYTQPISEVRSCRPRAASVPAVRAPGQIETACRVSNAGSPSHNVQGVQSILTAKRMLSLWEETRAISPVRWYCVREVLRWKDSGVKRGKIR